jgi:hypothetical protein
VIADECDAHPQSQLQSPEDELREQLDRLVRYDMARVSGRQLEMLRGLIEALRSPPLAASCE